MGTFRPVVRNRKLICAQILSQKVRPIVLEKWRACSSSLPSKGHKNLNLITIRGLKSDAFA